MSTQLEVLRTLGKLWKFQSLAFGLLVVAFSLLAYSQWQLRQQQRQLEVHASRIAEQSALVHELFRKTAAQELDTMVVVEEQ